MTRVVRVAVKAGLVAVAVALVYFGVTFVQVWQASRRDGARPAQAIVVLGAAQYNGRPSAVFRSRLDHAAALYEQDVADVVVVTGGRQPGDQFTEASAAAGYLARRGIPEAALRLETSGVNSWQSLAAAARFLRREGITDVVLVSSRYHALRIEHIAAEVGLDGHASPTPVNPESAFAEAVHLGRETLAVGIGRIIGYHRLVELDDRVGRVRSRGDSR